MRMPDDYSPHSAGDSHDHAGSQNSGGHAPHAEGSILASAAALSPDAWGEMIYRDEYPPMCGTGPAHVSHEVIGTVEGLLSLRRCSACGGRHQLVADMRRLAGEFDERLATASELLDRATGRHVDSWAVMHAWCAESPLVHEVPTRVAELVQSHVDAAAAKLLVGEAVHGELRVIMEDEQVVGFPVGLLPPANATDGARLRKMAVHTMHAALREFARLRHTRAAAAVLVAEAWCATVDVGSPAGVPPRDDPMRSEVLAVVAATPSAIFAATAPLTRERGLPGVGPGLVGAFELEVVTEPSLLLDGLLASFVSSGGSDDE